MAAVSVLLGSTLLMAGCAHLRRGSDGIPDYPSPEISATGKVEVAVQYAVSTAPHMGYNTLEVYFQNHSLKPVEFKSISLDGRVWPVVSRKTPAAFKSMSVGGQDFSLTPPPVSNDKDVTWWQFYPSAKVASGETIALQVNLRDAARLGRNLEIVDVEDKHVRISVPRVVPPQARITAVTYSLDYSQVYVQYQSNGVKPQRLWINNMPVELFRDLQSAVYGAPSMLSLKAPFRITTGMPIHVRIRFVDGQERHCLIRALSGISLDAPFAVKSRGFNPAVLGLDAHPAVEFSGYDVACNDAGNKNHGGCGLAVAEERREFFTKHKDRLLGLVYCTAVYPEVWNIYGQVADAVYAKTYRLGWAKNKPRFIEEEEECVSKAWRSAQPRPFLWIPDRWKTQGGRYLESEELQVMGWTALVRGAKGIRYHFWKDADQPAFDENPGLLQGIIKLDGQIATNRQVLSSLALEAESVVGEEGRGWIKVYTAWAGDSGILVMVRNLNYRSNPGNPGGQDGFKVQVKDHLMVDVVVPKWMEPEAVRDFITGSPVQTTKTAAGFQVELDRLEAFRLIWIGNKRK